VDESLRDIRVSLLEADVAFDVVKKFVARVREKAVGESDGYFLSSPGA
jgi:signal recognition particle subunit SRP54